MPKFATLDPKFSNISIAKNKVPWVDKLFQDMSTELLFIFYTLSIIAEVTRLNLQ